jgi:hypothetical protein
VHSQRTNVLLIQSAFSIALKLNLTIVIALMASKENIVKETRDHASLTKINALTTQLAINREDCIIVHVPLDLMVRFKKI